MLEEQEGYRWMRGFESVNLDARLMKIYILYLDGTRYYVGENVGFDSSDNRFYLEA